MEDAVSHRAPNIGLRPRGMSRPKTRRQQLPHRSIHPQRLLQPLLR
jgi:hypothetical protein